jgi:hypothetical protein
MNRLRILAATGAVAAIVSSTLLASQSAAAASRRITCDGHTATIVGTSGDDTIIGTNGNDVIAGRGGDDLILGLRGNDIICGNAGNDVINAMRGSVHQPLDGGDGKDLCVFPQQDTSVVHNCEAQQHPDPLHSDPPPNGGPNQGHVKRAQSVSDSASCTTSHGKINVVMKGRVSPYYDNPAKILVEPVLFKYNRSTTQWQQNFLDVHTIQLQGYNGTWHDMTVRSLGVSSPPGAVYYVGYYVQWYTEDGNSFVGNRWTFASNYPHTFSGQVMNTGLCLPKLG